jgi:hypothetical protein
MNKEKFNEETNNQGIYNPLLLRSKWFTNRTFIPTIFRLMQDYSVF